MRILFYALLGSLAATSALAQAPVCRTQGSVTCGPAKSASSLIGSTGPVSILRQSANLPGASGSLLTAGDRVVTIDGSATIAIGSNCRVPLAQNMSALVYATETETCVSLATRAPVAAVPPQAGGAAAGYALGGLAAAGGIAAIAIGASKSGSNPRLSP